jgi:TPR repeat protein
VDKHVLSECYRLGQGVAKNQLEADHLLDEAIAKGFALSQAVRGAELLARSPDAAAARQAVELLEKAWAAGVTSAAAPLARAYGGLAPAPGVSPDPAKAVRLLEEAARRNEPEAKATLAGLYLAGKKGLPPRGNDQVLRLLTDAANSGHAEAQVTLARTYCRDVGQPGSLGKRDYRLALSLAQLAADQGHAGADVVLAQLYKSGLGAAPDAALARKHLERAADAGLIDALWLNAIYAKNQECGYTKKDLNKALQLFVKAFDRDPQGVYLNSPLFLEPKPVAFRPNVWRELQQTPKEQRYVKLVLAISREASERAR